jgi:hypothetical protein
MKKNGLKLINEIGMDFIPFKYNQLGKNTDQTLNRLYFQLGTYISEFGEYLLAPTDWGTERSWHRLMIFQK